LGATYGIMGQPIHARQQHASSMQQLDSHQRRRAIT